MQYSQKVTRESIGGIAIAIVLLLAAVAGIFAATKTVHAATGSGSVTVAVSVQGGTAQPQDFTVQIKQNGTSNSGTTSGSGNSVSFDVAPGSYTLSESKVPSGYSVSWGGACNAQGVVTVTSGGTVSCTVTNTFGPVGSIKVTTVIKGGTATAASFTAHIKKASATDTGSPSGTGSPIVFGQLAPGAYTVIESVVTGYTTTWSGACNAQGNVTVSGNATASCTVTNTFAARPPTGGNGNGGGSSSGGRTRPIITLPVRPTR